jgi:hypothetical protein
MLFASAIVRNSLPFSIWLKLLTDEEIPDEHNDQNQTKEQKHASRVWEVVESILTP